MRTATVVLADTHQLFLQGLRLIVEARQEFTVEAMVTDGFEALEACRQKMPSLLIIDSTLPGLDALEVSRQLGRYSSRTKILLTMPMIQHERLAQAVKCGVHAAVLKSAGVEQFYNSIDAIRNGQTRFPAELTPAGSQYIRSDEPEPIETPYSRLTARERTIFKLLAEGNSVKQVAHRLSLKPKTVDVHKTNLMRKLDVHDRGELIHFAFREGLLNIASQPGM